MSESAELVPVTTVINDHPVEYKNAARRIVASGALVLRTLRVALLEAHGLERPTMPG